MSPIDPQPHPAGCGCCEGPTPGGKPQNRPGLPALDYRLGVHGAFLRRMTQRLARLELPDGSRPLARLTTRSLDDPSMAFLDAWAIVADVLSFYQERVANEGFLRTATERRSVLELARAIGYELNPGVAASTYLAFTAEDAEGAPDQVFMPAGSAIMSIPGQDQLPQTFETSDDLVVRPDRNTLRPRMTLPLSIEIGQTAIHLKGVSTQLRPGDALLIVGDTRLRRFRSERWDVRVLQTVEEFPDRGYTRVTWAQGLGHKMTGTLPAAENPRPYAFRLRANLFGHNAPDWRMMPDSIRQEFDPRGRQRTQWPDFQMPEDHIDLDADYPKIVAGSWVVLTRPGYTELYRVVTAVTASRTDFGLTSKVTRIQPDTRESMSWFGLRDTVVLAESEELQFYEEPIGDPVEGDEVALDTLVDGLVEGQPIAVSGIIAGSDDEAATEIAFIRRVLRSSERTTIRLSAALRNSYERSSTTINANVVAATHGETVTEILGSGDGAAANQRFTLKKPPLTYVSAATPTGALSTLSVRVDGVEWTESSSLYGAPGDSETYMVRIDNDGKATVSFGDGRQGARLPTGQENTRAVYRSGIGPEGQVPAGSLSMPKSRPQGLKGVVNPEAASGAAAPEDLGEARAHAPLTVLTLDRVVALKDYEDFAEAFAGIGKAHAVALWSGETRLVYVTVAGESGEAVPETSALYTNLTAAVDAARDPVQQVEIASHHPVGFVVEAAVAVDRLHVAEDVIQACAESLRLAFSFERRAFAQPVTSAEVVTILQETPGVIAVRLEKLYRSDDPPGAAQSRPPAVLEAASPRWSAGHILPAELLLIDPSAIALREMQP